MKVLLAPLDWGLGHASRCVPVVRELQRQGCEVMIAGSGDSLELLRKEFPLLKTFSIPGYAPRYPAGGSMVWAMARQVPRFMRVMATEHRLIENLIEKEKVDRLISDNRYGCWSDKIPCVFITHQSNVLMPKRFGWLQNFVRRLNDRMINHFDVCWIPDLDADRSLAGDLISFGKSNVKIRKEHIGWLSRFQSQNNVVKKYDVLAIFSGPEPQRTALENRVVPQLRNSELTFRIVRGLPSANNAGDDARIVNFLTSAALQNEIQAADLIIARSGYSTVMDMRALGKKVIFIPTPGQTEQEYLAQRLTEKRVAFHMEQDSFDLATALRESGTFSGFTPGSHHSFLKEAVERFLA